jgi:ribosomal protein L40E
MEALAKFSRLKNISDAADVFCGMPKDPLSSFKYVIELAEKARRISQKLTRSRFVHETDEQTLDRIIHLARKIICDSCGGKGTFAGSSCRKCAGTGERPYNPFDKIVKEVVES